MECVYFYFLVWGEGELGLFPGTLSFAILGGNLRDGGITALCQVLANLLGQIFLQILTLFLRRKHQFAYEFPSCPV